MKLSPYFLTWAIALCHTAASRPSTVDRSAALARNRPAGGFRLTDAKHHRKLQDYTTIDGFTCFRNIEGMTQAMFDLQTNHPDLVTVEIIGESYQGRDIYVMKITAAASDDRAQVFFTGGQHARELAPPELLMRFAEKLVAEYDTNADITWVLDTTQINIVLYVNPDGRIIAENDPSLYWRKNANPNDGTCSEDSIGTDLNRNYDWMWGDTNGASSNPCDEDYHGSGPASEPEVQAIVAYAKTLFPVSQRKTDPVAEMNVPFGEEITGVYMDVHSYGGLTYYPWGFEDVVSPDNDSLEALGRKLSFFNGYVLWAGGQPDFLYPATGDASDWMYAHLGVASLGLEIGDSFYQDCDNFEKTVYPDNLNTLLYTIKLAKKPNKVIKGPDVLDLVVTETDGEITISADASDSELVNIDGYPSFSTGEQTVSKIELYFDVLPDEYGDDDTMYLLQPIPIVNSDRVSAETEISTAGLTSGRHAVYAVATDSDGYTGPVSSIFFKVENVSTLSPITPTSSPTIAIQTTTTTFTTTTTEIETEPPSKDPTAAIDEPTNAPSSAPIAGEVTEAPTFQKLSSSAPTVTVTMSSLPTINAVTPSPSVLDTGIVGSPAPSTDQMTTAPSVSGESETSTTSPAPSVETLGDSSTDAFSEAKGSPASNISLHLIGTLVLALVNYLL